MPPVPIAAPIASTTMLQDDRECDGDGAHRWQRVEPREARRCDRRTDRESHQQQNDKRSIQPCAEEPGAARSRESLNPPNPADHERNRLLRRRSAELAALPPFGSQIVRRPSTISAAKTTVMTSNT